MFNLLSLLMAAMNDHRLPSPGSAFTAGKPESCPILEPSLGIRWHRTHKNSSGTARRHFR